MHKAYLKSLADAIKRLHGCAARHVESVGVDERFQGKPVWQGSVEVFDIIGHTHAKRCFAWSHLEGEGDKQERFVAVLCVPPIDTPLKAVRASLIQQHREKARQ